MNRNGLGLAFALCVTMAQGMSWGDGVTRALEPVVGGCKVTLAWDFSGKVESDLIVEERLAPGWSVDSSTVSVDSLDATSFSGSVARFAVKPTLTAGVGSISFVIRPGDDLDSGFVSGDWKLYQNGALRKGAVGGSSAVSAKIDRANQVTGGAESATGGTLVEKAVAIASFKVVDGSGIELGYVGVTKAGTLVVEGCERLGGAWTTVKRKLVTAACGSIELTADEADGYKFYRMKVLTEEK